MTEQYEGDDRRQARYSNIEHNFYEKPIFSLGAVVALAICLVGVVLYVADIDHRATQTGKDNKSEIKHVRELHDLQKERFEGSIKDVKGQLDKIDEKLDKLINRELDR